ncbi:ArsR/SmtB family transcription factor [Luteimonas notoginsengisoli]|jgi:DNA-binding transcriptional ArsR family regulator|uniref:ArsR/SmtB family transcription factor n=1 Tax=Luteimonas notoginsengisoli TaxID=1578200 RepID=A0ABV7UXC7_9GAMM
MSNDASAARSARMRWSRRAAAAAVVFAALGDATRLELVGKLGDGGQRSITELGQDSALTRQAITKHLRVLEEAGVVRSRRQGRESLFALNPKSIVGLQDYLALVSGQWDDALSRLKRLVEQPHAV